MLLGNNTKSHCWTCGVSLSNSSPHTLALTPFVNRELGYMASLFCIIITDRPKWLEWWESLILNERGPVCLPCLNHVAHWPETEEEVGGSRPHILTSAKHLSWAVHAGAAHLPSFCSPALRNTTTVVSVGIACVFSCLLWACALFRMMSCWYFKRMYWMKMIGTPYACCVAALPALSFVKSQLHFFFHVKLTCVTKPHQFALFYFAPLQTQPSNLPQTTPKSVIFSLHSLLHRCFTIIINI